MNGRTIRLAFSTLMRPPLSSDGRSYSPPQEGISQNTYFKVHCSGPAMQPNLEFPTTPIAFPLLPCSFWSKVGCQYVNIHTYRLHWGHNPRGRQPMVYGIDLIMELSRGMRLLLKIAGTDLSYPSLNHKCGDLFNKDGVVGSRIKTSVLCVLTQSTEKRTHCKHQIPIHTQLPLGLIPVRKAGP